MNVNIGYAVILPFRDFHPRGQANVAYIKICYKTLSFICISGSIFWNLIKLCMNFIIEYVAILLFHDFHLRGQANVAYIKICYKTSSLICISGSIFWNLIKLCMNFIIEYAAILLFHDFHLRGQITVAYV